MKRIHRLARPRPQAARGALAPPTPRVETLDFTEIGARGDAVAAFEGAPVYAPFILPGETARVRVLGERAELIALEQASAARVAPVCRHFGRCGGCALQHWADVPMLAWKRDLVIRALARRGVEAQVAETIAAWGAGRRRAAFHARRAGAGVRVGFIERGGARLTDLAECPVLTPALVAALPALRELAALLAPERGELSITCLESEVGVDVNIKGAARAAARDGDMFARIGAVMEAHDLARVSLDGEPVLTRHAPVLTMDSVRVAPPPGAFVQATRAGEEALASLAMAALAGARRIVDLFAGCGTFSLRAASLGEVHAVEGDEDMRKALQQAADGALRKITTARRDLVRTPVSAIELKPYDGAILDPPRAGARLQAQQIATSRIVRVAAVSCDPASFARDARILIDGGFSLTRVTPVDQFRWSPHVELVGIFTR